MRLFPEPDGMGDGRTLREVEYLHVRAKRIVNKVPEASRMPFRYTINAYRGCAHACTYCFARPTHTYLGMDAGEDFERRIVVKVNAVERLTAELRDPRWEGEHIAMGTNTDPYQPAEGRYRLTRGLIGALTAARNPFSILTKSPMILRDLDLLGEAARAGLVRCNLSIGTLDEDVWRASEPGTPPPRRRVEAVARLNAAGIPCGVLIAPVLPGMSDSREQLGEVVDACVEAGAVSVSPILLHLRPGVREVFMPWLEGYRPDLVERYRKLYSAAYATPGARARLSQAVDDLVDRLGGTAVPPARSRDAA
jgi:DNA repair photolyase